MSTDPEAAMHTLCTCSALLKFTTILPILAPPGPPRDVMISGVSDTTLTVTWSSPISKGGREELYYTVEFVALKSGEENFTKAGEGITDMEFTISGLTAVTEYRVRVIAENDVSDQDSDVMTQTSSPVIEATGEGSKFLNQ